MKYEKGQLIKFSDNKKKNRPVSFGVIKKSNDNCITVQFYDTMKLTCTFAQTSIKISLASLKEVEHFISLRKNELQEKIEEAKKYYKKQTHEIKSQYIYLRPFINKID